MVKKLIDCLQVHIKTHFASLTQQSGYFNRNVHSVIMYVSLSVFVFAMPTMSHKCSF